MVDSDFNPIPVLDYGYVKLIESWGSDERIIEAARMSTNKGFQGWGSQCECQKLECRCKWDESQESYNRSCDSCIQQQSCPKCGGRGYFVGDEKLLSLSLYP